MDSSSGSDSAASNPSLFASLKNCQGCQKRKEYLQTMLTDSRFWVGVLVGFGGTWAYHKYLKK
jgi:hypothetical protein